MANSKTPDGVEVTALEQRIHNGVVFEAAHKLTVANTGGTGQMLFRTGAKRVIVHERRVTANGDEITYQAFRGPTVTADGSSVSITKRNGNAAIDPTVLVFQGTTVSADGSGIPAVYMPGATGQGQSSEGQFQSDSQVRILEPNTDYLIRVTNDGAKVSASIEVYLMWAEVAPN